MSYLSDYNPMEQPKKFLLIDDDEEHRNLVVENLKDYNFEVIAPENPAEAAEKLERLWNEIYVVLVDMDLNKWKLPLKTGADIVQEVHKKLREAGNYYSPEFLINSIHLNNAKYYQLALNLGAAAYLPKEIGLGATIRHLRALALRQSLQPDRPEIEAAISRIAVFSKNPKEAVINFCKELLAPEFENCLGVPLFLLLSDKGKTEICYSSVELPAGADDFYGTLHALAQSHKSIDEPFVVKSEELKEVVSFDKTTEETAVKFNGTAFFPLTINQNLRLSLGILQKFDLDSSLPTEDAKALCQILAQYLKPTLIEHFIHLLSQWNRLRTMMHNTSQLCLLFGQEQRNILQGMAYDDVPSLQIGLPSLQTLANDLYSTGQILSYIGHSNGLSPTAASENAADFVREKWLAVAGSQRNDLLRVEGDCQLWVEPDDLQIIVSRLLQWVAKRLEEQPLDVEPKIRVSCAEMKDWKQLVFEDRSRRLSPRLRAELFAPFSQAISVPFDPLADFGSAGLYLPLYLVKMLVEGKYGGTVEDHSDEISGVHGNRIVIKFPNSESVVAPA